MGDESHILRPIVLAHVLPYTLGVQSGDELLYPFRFGIGGPLIDAERAFRALLFLPSPVSSFWCSVVDKLRTLHFFS